MRSLDYWTGRAIPLEDMPYLTGYLPDQQGLYWADSFGIIRKTSKGFYLETGKGTRMRLLKATERQQGATLWARPEYSARALEYTTLGDRDRDSYTLEQRRVNATELEREDYNKQADKVDKTNQVHYKYTEDNKDSKDSTNDTLEQAKYFGLGWFL